MRICQRHWDACKAAIVERGLARDIAKDGAEAMRRALEGRDDPLMTLHWMLTNRALEMLGLGLMSPAADGGERCQVCELSAACAASEKPCGTADCADALIPSAADFLAQQAAIASA